MSIIYEKHDKYTESIIIRKFIGKANINTIIDSWRYLYENEVINEKTRGLIDDFTDCELNMDTDCIEILMHFMKKRAYIRKIKIGVVSNSPKIIVFPFYCRELEMELDIRPFSTR